MKVLVTGGAGHIGSQLAGVLAWKGHQVTILDDFSEGRVKNVSGILSLEDFHKEVFHLVVGSILDFDLVKNLVRDKDVVFHLAGKARIQYCVHNPIEGNEANVRGTLNILEAVRQLKSKARVIYSASSSYYGNAPKLPETEDLPPNPLNPYAIQKYVGELYCKNYSEIYGVETVRLRYFNVYGPGQNPDGFYATVVGKFIKQVRSNKSPTIVGSGTARRDYTFIEDVIDANILAAETPGISGEVFNIGTGENYSTEEVANLIIKLSGKDIEPIHIPPRPGEADETLADITKAKKILGYSPKYTFKQGILEMLNNWEV